MTCRYIITFLMARNRLLCNLFRDCFESVSRWMSSNRLKLNPLKTELIWLHCSSRRNPTFLRKDIVLFGSPITPVNVVRNLGVILDENMTMSEHIARVCQNCYYQLRQIRRIKRSLTANSITLLVLASVHSRLDYCNSVLYSLPWSRLWLLQSVLNSAARLIRGLKRFDHISPVLIELHWLPYPQRVKYKVCMLMFKCLEGSRSGLPCCFLHQGFSSLWSVGEEIRCSWGSCCA